MSGGFGAEPTFTEVKLPCNPNIAGTPKAVPMTGNMFNDLDAIADAMIDPDIKIASEEGIISKSLLDKTSFNIAHDICTPSEWEGIYSAAESGKRLKQYIASNKQFALGILYALGGFAKFDSVPAYFSKEDSNFITNTLATIDEAYCSEKPDKANTH